MVGERVGHYQVLEALGRGGMGEVFRARDLMLERDVALKFLPSDFSKDFNARRRFISEARAASALDHPNICAVHEIGETEDGVPFIAMALCRGDSLKDCLADGPLPPERCIEIARQIATGLFIAHSAGVVHRDVKPSNIIIGDGDEVKIVDFGLARMPKGDVTRVGSVLGTTGYMAPEQLRGERVDERADIWSFGVVLFEMLTGRSPFEAAYEQAAAFRVMFEPHDRLPDEIADAHPGLVEIIDACLEKDASLRPSSMAEIQAALKTATAERPAGVAEPVGRPPEKVQRSWSRIRQYPRLWASAAILVAAALLFSLSLYRDSGAVPEEKFMVVLPFINLGGDAEGQRVCDGLLVTLTNKLVQLSAFTEQHYWVVPASEVLAREVASPSTAHQIFGATLALEGSVIRTESSVRLTLNVVDTRAMRTLHAIDVSSDGQDLLSLQEEAIKGLTRIMNLSLARGSERAMQAGGTRDPRAYDFYVQGRGYLERREPVENLDAAIELFNRAIERDSRFALGYAALSEAYWRYFESTRNEQYLGPAREYSDRALQIDPELPQALVSRAILDTGTGRAAEGVRHAQRAVELEPGNVDAHIALANAKAATQNYHEAESILRRVVDMKPHYWIAYNTLGRFYTDRGRFDDAVEQFETVVSLTPDNARGHSNLGAAYFNAGRTEDARAPLERSVQLAPTYAAYSNLASYHFAVGNMEEAARYFEEALSIEDNNYLVWANLASAYDKMEGRKQDARRAFERAIVLAERQLELGTGDQEVVADLANFNAYLGRESEAWTLLEQLERQPIETVQTMFELATAYELLGSRSRAVDWLCRAVENGFPLIVIEEDVGLRNLRSDPAFERVNRCLPS